jgi:hypothetical protein
MKDSYTEFVRYLDEGAKNNGECENEWHVTLTWSDWQVHSFKIRKVVLEINKLNT